MNWWFFGAIVGFVAFVHSQRETLTRLDVLISAIVSLLFWPFIIFATVLIYLCNTTWWSQPAFKKRCE